MAAKTDKGFDFSTLSYSKPTDVEEVPRERKPNPLDKMIGALLETWDEEAQVSKATSTTVPDAAVKAFTRHAYNAATAVGKGARVRAHADGKGNSTVTVWLRPAIKRERKPK